MKRKPNPPLQNDDLWLGKPAPRYTSYPPAPFFHPGVTESDYGRSLKQLTVRSAVSLYVHIPFCRALCLYCGCNATATHRQDRINAYLAALKREIEMIARLTGKVSVQSLHFGGGTPNLLNPQDLSDLFACLNQHFDLAPAREIAMELDPREVTPEQVKVLAASGVTRVSLGVQDFDPRVQEIIHRKQPFDQVASVCALLRAQDIDNINLDLIYGLPEQTPDTVSATAELACSLAPKRIVLFSYAHVPQFKKHQQALEVYGLPDVRERLKLEETARRVLISRGYCPIGIDHFATEDDPLTTALHSGTLRRNFQGYTEDAAPTLLGFGCSAISQTEDGYFQSEHNERSYQTLIAQGKLPVKRGFLLSDEDRARRAVIERLMCALSCDTEALCHAQAYPIEKLRGSFEGLKPYAEAGLISINGYTIVLKCPSRMAIRIICKAFDTHTIAAQPSLSSHIA